MPEFDLIDRIRARVAPREDVILGIGDDAALLQVPAGMQLAVSMDTLNAGVHFPHDTAPADIGWKALAVNLSDLAAMGAQPAWCTLSLSLPEPDSEWLDRFLDGFLALASRHDVALVGGDTTRGPLSISVTVHGFVVADAALRRNAARVGDDVWVSGTLGDAAAALALWSGRASTADTTDHAAIGEASAHGNDDVQQQLHAWLRSRLDRPEPRLEVGRALSGLAHAAIDVSDGLLADLAHVCAASNVGVELQLQSLPMSPVLRASFDEEQAHGFQASGGDDYELCFTAPVSARDRIWHLRGETGVTLTRIGSITEGGGVRVRDANGQLWRPARSGYEHFGAGR